MQLGIAGWALNRSIRELKTLDMLGLIALAREEYNVNTLELVSTFFESQGAAYLNKVRQAIEAHRLSISNIAVDTGTLSSPDPATRRTDIETIKQWFHVARAIGAEAIRVNTGHAEANDHEALERVIEGYQELAAHGAENGVKLLIENHGGVSAEPSALRAILDGVDAAWFGACPDIANFPGDTWEEGMRIMAPRATVAHVKISGYDPSGWQEYTARDGSRRRWNAKTCLAILTQAGYSGPLNFEYNHAEADERVGVARGLAYTRELLAAL